MAIYTHKMANTFPPKVRMSNNFPPTAQDVKPRYLEQC